MALPNSFPHKMLRVSLNGAIPALLMFDRIESTENSEVVSVKHLSIPFVFPMLNEATTRIPPRKNEGDDQIDRARGSHDPSNPMFGERTGDSNHDLR